MSNSLCCRFRFPLFISLRDPAYWVNPFILLVAQFARQIPSDSLRPVRYVSSKDAYVVHS